MKSLWLRPLIYNVTRSKEPNYNEHTQEQPIRPVKKIKITLNNSNNNQKTVPKEWI